MAIEGFDTRKELAVVADGDEHLHVRSNGSLKDR